MEKDTPKPGDAIKKEGNLSSILHSVAEKFGGTVHIATAKDFHRTRRAVEEPKKKDANKPYDVIVDDIWNYMDSDTRLFAGSYGTEEEAKEICMSILVESLDTLYKSGMTAEELAAQWWTFGDDPWVSGLKAESVPFLGTSYIKDKAFLEAFVQAKRANEV